MGPDKAAMEKLYLTWLPYGGPTEFDIFVTFGLTQNEFYRRIEPTRRNSIGTAGIPTPETVLHQNNSEIGVRPQLNPRIRRRVEFDIGSL
ncbi:MAG: hypothetical protein EOO27_30410 [Comamonadaceae bacterium]|nr:MAG: hypothetical protein EOO27_30410 [Comamonadaceae bacterium]